MHTKAISFYETAQNYDIFLVDVVGVVHDGHGPIKSAIDAVNTLISQNKNIIFLSNNPRPGKGVYTKLIESGVDQRARVFTSGDATIHLLHRQFPGQTLYHLGAERNDQILANINYKTTPHLAEADFILLTAYLNPEEDISKHEQEIDFIVKNKKQVICANPDVYAPMEHHQIRKCAGFIAKHLEDRGAQVIYAGKPSVEIYKAVFDVFDIPLHDKSKCLMIGDTLETDIKGANGFGIDSVLVLTGNTGRSIKEQKTTPEQYFSSHHTHPTVFYDTLI